MNKIQKHQSSAEAEKTISMEPRKNDSDLDDFCKMDILTGPEAIRSFKKIFKT
jgi:hypothetical protein